MQHYSKCDYQSQVFQKKKFVCICDYHKFSIEVLKGAGQMLHLKLQILDLKSTFVILILLIARQVLDMRKKKGVLLIFKAFLICIK